MKEHGIIFKGPLVRAIMEGAKTQTRRVPSSANTLVDGGRVSAKAWKAFEWDWDGAVVDPGPSVAGYPGPFLKVPSRAFGTGHRLMPKWAQDDGLWVRETWRVKLMDGGDELEGVFLGYAADDGELYCGEGFTRKEQYEQALRYHSKRWKSSIHMPRWASRLTLQVTRVWPERVQEISYEDELAEGCQLAEGENRFPFRTLWDEINGPRGWAWELNRPVWCIEFERVEGAGKVAT
ncbi:hypothetical protein LCGC14_1860730 [marine sediment metagenome]|uniref:Uncharacterized protein n=1 Tax=marine sediment metagenome TaxID=412755 RepID=A0A0F9GW17_9ZZZZ